MNAERPAPPSFFTEEEQAEFRIIRANLERWAALGDGRPSKFEKLTKETFWFGWGLGFVTGFLSAVMILTWGR